ncbi:hypothetical protein B0T14DRAFT_512438 [Immersiella caudata]|uniref:C2H2-type domain-containing protein n=1 Tax=Immersiella caudata TaxID=314043 RepID=A0AA40C702_9PEZI|nr:hypothetical protein B0T14DRAFT_512438 [Immersiella caudata]
MSSTIKALGFSPQAKSNLSLHGCPGASPAEYDSDTVRDSSPCPSLVHSATATDLESEAGDGMVPPFYVPVPAVGFPIHVEAKGHDEVPVYSAGADDPHQTRGPHDANCLGSDFSDDGTTVNQGTNCGHDCSVGGKLGGGEGDGPEGPSPQSPDRPATGADAVEESRGWACPFRKHDPLLFNVRDHFSCSHLPFRTFGKLKEHLNRNHAPQAGHGERCPSRAAAGNECTCNISSSRMGVEVMEKINDMACPTPQKQPTWEAMYKVLFGRLEPVPNADWEPPIELEEYFFEIKQRLDVFRERVKLETRNLIPDHEATQVRIWSSMTDIFVFFLEQTMSSCQRRVRGNTGISYFGPDCSWSRSPGTADIGSIPHELLGFGDWSNMFHDRGLGGEQIVHRDVCPPSSLLLAVRRGERGFFCRVDCTNQEQLAILGMELPLAGSGTAKLRTAAEVQKKEEEERASMEVDEDDRRTLTPDSTLSPMDTSRVSSRTSAASRSQSEDQSTDDEDAESGGSDDEDAIADEMISRVCDIVLRYCGGPTRATSNADLDAIGQAVGTAVTDFVYELLNELSAAPRIVQCTGRGTTGPSPTFTPEPSGGGFTGSSGAPGDRRAGLGGQGASNSGHGSQGFGGNGPTKPGQGGLAHGKDPPAEFRWSCPYRKHNPQRFSISNKRYKQCATTGWRTFDRLKRHLRDKHNPTPIECSRCKEGFRNVEALDQHNLSQPPCEVRNAAPTDGVNPDDGMSAHVVRRLNSRREEDRIPSWEILYRALFPAETAIPIPDFEPPEETTCSELRRYMNAALPDLQQEISKITPAMANAIIELVQRSQDQAFTKYETSLQQKLGSKRSSAPEDSVMSAKRPRMSSNQALAQPPHALLQFPPPPQQHQTIHPRHTDQGWVDVSRPTDSQPQPRVNNQRQPRGQDWTILPAGRPSNPQPQALPVNDASAIFMQQQGVPIMGGMSAPTFLSGTGSEPTGSDNFQMSSNVFGELDNIGAWSASMTDTPGPLSTDMNAYSFDGGSFYPVGGNRNMSSGNTEVDEDTGSYTDIGRLPPSA